MNQKGMTLIELTVVLLILIALAGLAIPYVGGTTRMALCQATDASMQAVKTAIMGGGPNSGFYMDLLGKYPRDRSAEHTDDYDLKYLFISDDNLDNDSNSTIDADEKWREYNAKTAVGWRGPYLMTGLVAPSGLNSSFLNVYASPDESTPNAVGTVHVAINGGDRLQVLDAWGRPIVIQVPYNAKSTPADATGTLGYNLDYARLISAGPGSGIAPGDAAIDTLIEYDSSTGGNPYANSRADDRVLFLKMPDMNGNQPCNE